MHNLNQKLETLRSSHDMSNNNAQFLIEDISMEEILSALDKAKIKSYPGPDCLSYEII